MCNNISLKIATDGSMIFGNQPQWALPCQMLPGFVPLGESLWDPKDVLLSNSAEFVQCPDITVSKKCWKWSWQRRNDTCLSHMFSVGKGNFFPVYQGRNNLCQMAPWDSEIFAENSGAPRAPPCPSPVVQSTELTGSIKLLCLPPEVGRCWLDKLEKGTIFHIEWKGTNELRIQFSITLVSDRSKPMKIIWKGDAHAFTSYFDVNYLGQAGDQSPINFVDASNIWKFKTAWHSWFRANLDARMFRAPIATGRQCRRVGRWHIQPWQCDQIQIQFSSANMFRAERGRPHPWSV